MHPDIQAANERKAKANAELRVRFADLLSGPHSRIIDMILHHIEPYYSPDPVAAMPEHLLTSDILTLLSLLRKATAAPPETSQS